MNTKEYNGWTNYETWLVKLWQDNDQGDQEYWQKQAEECVRVDGEHAPTSLSDIMKEHYEEASCDLARRDWLLGRLDERRDFRGQLERDCRELDRWRRR